MNIVYLIGNGFDLNLGMRTRYNDFYHYLFKLEEKVISHIADLKRNIEDNRDNWSDLELALGGYVGGINAAAAIELHDHLLKHLSEYLTLEESKCAFSERQRRLLFEYLKSPHLGGRLLQNEANTIANYLSSPVESWNIKIMTFNYTKTIELLSGYNNASIAIDRTISLAGVEHIHGFTDKRMILGVNDISQIANNELHKETAIIDRYVKSECNSTYGLEHDVKCQRWISQANLVCLFGLSFGNTDKKWWELIGEALKGGCRIIIFEYAPKMIFNGNQGPALKAAKEEIKEFFLSKTTLDEGGKSRARNKIFIALNTDMFRFEIPPKV